MLFTQGVCFLFMLCLINKRTKDMVYFLKAVKEFYQINLQFTLGIGMCIKVAKNFI